jgi:hypothetical protein
MLKMQVNSNATKQMESVISKLDTFPNRIASAQQSALARSANQLVKQMEQRYRAAKYLQFKIDSSGPLGAKLTISPPDQRNINTYWAAAILLKGRKGGQIVRAKRGGYMKLREQSVIDGYPPYLKQFRMGKVQSQEQYIKYESRELIIKNIRYAVERFGFGPKGGAQGLEDLGSIRSRAK